MPGFDTLENILKEFDRKLPVLEGFREACERLVKQIIHANNLQVHSVTSRVKERQKLKAKVDLKDYQSFDEVTDLIGVRIITNFEDDVDEVAAVIEREFHIDPEESVDKRKLLDPDRFGYLSLHYVCTLNDSRGKLIEYEQYRGIRCEIQIRSILQHAWAEIEHDLGYKANTTVPALVRRRFSRLAGLLELADAEFALIRDDLNRYSARVKTDVLQKPSEVALDDVSLAAFLKLDPLVNEVDTEIARATGAQLLKDRERIQKLVEELRYVGFVTISDVKFALEARKELILAQGRERARAQIGREALHRGVSLYQLFQVIVVQEKGVDGLKEAFARFGICAPDQRDLVARRIADIVERASSQ